MIGPEPPGAIRLGCRGGENEMKDNQTRGAVPAAADTCELSDYGQVVLVFQGGGALGAYQAGVYQALVEAGIQPDWVIGTSIGAINAAIVAGNPPDRRVARLREFWTRMEFAPLVRMASTMPIWGPMAATAATVTSGLPGFFQPNPWAFFSNHLALGAERAGYYSTEPLERTLAGLIDPALLNACQPRLTVGAANIRTGEMRYFDSRDGALSIRHVMASGALPPAFPAIRIDGELYWDGGILSNTPVETVFDDMPRRNSIIFAVHVWSPNGPEPDSIVKVMSRQKDLQYASRAKSHVERQRQIHKLRHVIAALAKRIPDELRQDPDIRDWASYGCVTRMHVVRLLAPPMAGEDHSKDIDFSPQGIRARWDAGYTDTNQMLRRHPWTEPVDAIEGFILHEARSGEPMARL
jgi:NTE family protein